VNVHLPPIDEMLLQRRRALEKLAAVRKFQICNKADCECKFATKLWFLGSNLAFLGQNLLTRRFCDNFQ